MERKPSVAVLRWIAHNYEPIPSSRSVPRFWWKQFSGTAGRLRLGEFVDDAGIGVVAVLYFGQRYVRLVG
ncbi:hypothetical protein B1T45_20835 [Mycobacterium kansasii]|uniref:Uncharacterized protein n=3 Tax=Mycobacterium kansasii TaxID=1768 RepID=A0A7G1I827_MYCKA|nr:hypothetical protein MKAN_08795 [Mycobacterium kansasii ATCC 12478]ARG63323.1 hypothetical protein B1T45_20835 [Mycobacterium kansasii]EUA01635.1 hypothetical protein I547_3338 [Mycobacterium kansasii 824]EUA17648.1 hypothetical protein I545_3114 [Mycobacterium kansasii 662]ARG70958.1 hypothetical protein B1T47_20145 [Mycobacterium kansasii]